MKERTEGVQQLDVRSGNSANDPVVLLLSA